MIRREFFIAIVFLLLTATSNGQVNHTLYFMDRIPQSNQLNPAIQPNCNVYIGFPALSTVYVDAGNNSLSVSKILQYNREIDSLITFLHPKADRNVFFNALKKKNNFYNNFQLDLLSFGFRLQNLYFHFNSAIKSYTYLTYPKSLMELVINGSELGKITDLKYFGLNHTTYAEISLGLSNKFDNDLAVGARIKFLSGLSNLSTVNNKFLIETFEDQNSKYINRISADMAFRTYAPFLKEVPSGVDVPLDSIFQLKDNPQNSIKPFESKGLAFDVGASYTGIDNVVLSASLIDLGFIAWNQNTYEFKMRSNYSMNGVEINADSLEEAFKNPIGSLNDSIQFSKTSKKYTTGLPTTLYVGGEYFLETYFSFGLMSVTQYYVNSWYQQFTFSGNFRPLHTIMLSLSYSFIQEGFDNIGAGITFRPLPPLQFYLVADRIPLHYGKQYIPTYARSFNIRFGLNLTFGYSRRIKDKPLSWE